MIKPDSSFSRRPRMLQAAAGRSESRWIPDPYRWKLELNCKAQSYDRKRKGGNRL